MAALGSIEVASLRREFKGGYTIWYRDVLRFVRDRARVVASLAQPLLFLFVLGYGLAPSVSTLAAGNVSYTQFVFPGILALTVLFTAIFSSVSIVWDREFGFLKEVMVAPVSRTAVALGKVAGGSTVAILQAVVILLLAPVIGIWLAWDQYLILLSLMLLLAAVMTSLGILVAARQRTIESFQVIMNFLLLPMFFLSGALFPLVGAPIWMRVLATVDPVTYGVDALRQVALWYSVPPELLQSLILHPLLLDVAILAGFGVVFLVPAIWLFGKQD